MPLQIPQNSITWVTALEKVHVVQWESITLRIPLAKYLELQQHRMGKTSVHFIQHKIALRFQWLINALRYRRQNLSTAYEFENGCLTCTFSTQSMKWSHCFCGKMHSWLLWICEGVCHVYVWLYGLCGCTMSSIQTQDALLPDAQLPVVQ